MQITGPIAIILFSLLCLTGACASDPAYRMAMESAKKPIRGGTAEFRIISYDGHSLDGRVLLGATLDPLVIDGRLFEGTDVVPENVRACGKTEPLEYLVADLPSSPREKDIITLGRGYWYGFNVHFWLFDKEMGPGPDCFDADLVVHVLDGRAVATLPIHVVRTDKPPAASDGGTPKPAVSE